MYAQCHKFHHNLSDGFRDKSSFKFMQMTHGSVFIQHQLKHKTVDVALSRAAHIVSCSQKTEDHVCPQAQEKTDRDADLLPPTTPLTQPSSLFASSDSLANDLRDHSDGIWNESQATVS